MLIAYNFHAMLDFVTFILFILKFNSYYIGEPEMNKKHACSNAVKRFLSVTK